MPGQKSSLLINLYHIINYLYSALTQKGFEVTGNKENRNSWSPWVSSVCQTLPVGRVAYIASNFTGTPPGANCYRDNRYRGGEHRPNYLASFPVHYGWVVRCRQGASPVWLTSTLATIISPAPAQRTFHEPDNYCCTKPWWVPGVRVTPARHSLPWLQQLYCDMFLILSVHAWRHEVHTAAER